MQIYHSDAHHSAIRIFTILLCKFTIVVHTTVLYAYLPKGYMQIYHVDAHHSAICIFTIILCKFTIVMHTRVLYAYLP